MTNIGLFSGNGFLSVLMSTLICSDHIAAANTIVKAVAAQKTRCFMALSYTPILAGAGISSRIYRRSNHLTDM